jgi:hypothetical protein
LSCLGDEDGKLATQILARLLRKVDDHPADGAE